MFKILSAIFGALVLLLTTAGIAKATFSIGETPATVNDNQSFTVMVNLTISGSSGNNYYLRAAFSHQDTPTSYFGYTKNNVDNWYNGTPSPIDHTQYYKVTMNEFNSWAGLLNVKPDSGSSAYKGPGVYNFKVGRYTVAGSGPTWSDNVATIAIAASSTPTPTPSPTSTPSPTPTPTPTSSPTPTPTLTPKPSPTSSSTTSTTSKTPTPTVSQKPTGTGTKLTDSGKVSNTNLILGIEEGPAGEGTESGALTTEEGSDQGKKPFLAIGLIALGLIFLGVAGYAFLRERSSGRIKDLDGKIS